MGLLRIPVAADPFAKEWLRSAVRPAAFTLDGGIGRITWDYAYYHKWPAVQPGDELVLTLNARQLRFRVSQVDNVPANWERFALASAAADDLTVSVKAGATRLVIWAVPTQRE